MYLARHIMDKDKETKKEAPEESKDNSIVIEETKDDVLGTEFSGDPEDFKNEVKNEAKKGRVVRILLPVLFFAIIGVVVGLGTWYIKNQGQEETKSTEEKIQTPPEVKEETTPETKETEIVEEEAITAPSSEEKKTTDYTVYTVKSGDTLSGIANSYDLTSQELADYNNISDVHSLQIGQKIKIPN